MINAICHSYIHHLQLATTSKLWSPPTISQQATYKESGNHWVMTGQLLPDRQMTNRQSPDAVPITKSHKLVTRERKTITLLFWQKQKWSAIEETAKNWRKFDQWSPYCCLTCPVLTPLAGLGNMNAISEIIWTNKTCQYDYHSHVTRRIFHYLISNSYHLKEPYQHISPQDQSDLCAL